MMVLNKRVLSCLAVLMFFLLNIDHLSPRAAHAAGEDWPMFKNNNLRTGFSLSVCPPTNHLLWQFEPEEAIYSSLVVSDNIVLANGQDCKLYALDLWTGDLLWEFSYDVSSCWHSHSSPTVSGGRVFFGARDTIYCIDLSSGTQLWQYDAQDSVSSSPLVADGKVFITLHNTSVIALNTDTGELSWDYATGGSSRIASPTYCDGRVYVPTYSGRIVVLDGETGGDIETIQILWRHALTPVIADGKLFTSFSNSNSSDDGLKVLDFATRDILWGDVIGAYQTTSPSVGYGKVFIGGDQLRAYNADTGELVWSYDNELRTDVAVADGKIIANFGRQLIVFDQATGDIVWQATGGSSYSSPAVASGMVLVGGGTVRCYYAHPHDVALDSLDIPFPVDPDEQVVLSVNVTNEGLNDETDVQVQLLVDQGVVATQTIPSLASLSAQRLSFDWTAPHSTQICDLEVRVQIASSEGRNDNNRLVRQVAVGGKTLRVPSEFGTLAAALDAADAGDSIRIGNGTYAETLVIDKSHVRLIADDPGSVTISGASEHDNALTLDADFSELSGLRVINGADSYSFAGIKINSSNNRISNCTISENGNGIIIGVGASNNVIDACTVSTNQGNGIRLYNDSENNLIENCIISGNGISSYVESAVAMSGRNNRLVNCDVVQNQDDGVDLVAADDCQLTGLTIRANGDTGLRLAWGYYGDSSGNLIQGCVIEEHPVGMSAVESPDNVFRDNRLQNNTYNLKLEDRAYRQDLDATNLIEGMPILYIRDQSDVIVDGSQQEIGMLIIVDCSNIQVRNASLSGNWQGMLLIDSNSSTIENCTFSNNYEGIYTTYTSSSNVIRNCQVSENVLGIHMRGACPLNRIENCLIRNNSDSGIFLDLNTHQVEVVQCEVTSNGNGIFTESSQYHSLRGNRIHNNSNGVVFGSNSFHNSVTSCEIFNNAENGVSLYAYGPHSVSNCTIVGNGGSGIVAGASSKTANCIIRGNGVNLSQPDLQVTHSNVEGGYPGDGNIDLNPLFIDEAGNDFRLQKESPCIDAGTVPDVAVLDLDGNNDGLAYPDMGAQEHPGKPDIFGLSLGNRFVYTSRIGTEVFESERSVTAYDRTSFDSPAYGVSFSQDGVEVQREWLEKRSGQVVLWQIEEIQFPVHNTIQFTDGLTRYWYPMRVGDMRNSTSPVSIPGVNDSSLRASMEASIVKKEMMTLDEKDFAVFKYQYTFRLWGDSIEERRITFYEWVSPYLGLVKYSSDQSEDRLKSFAIGGGFIDGSGSTMAFYDILDDPKVDSDMDGVPDLEEKGPYLNDADYDGNGDNIPDGDQANVFSSYTADGAHYITLSVPSPATISSAEVSDDATLPEPPSNVVFTCGFFSFTLNGMDAGDPVMLTLYLEEGMTPYTYFKFGPTADDSSDHWYEFLYDGETGAEIDGNTVHLHFVDAGRGDDVLQQDGMIVDIGAPGFQPNTSVTETNASDTGGGGGGGCFVNSLRGRY